MFCRQRRGQESCFDISILNMVLFFLSVLTQKKSGDI